MNNRSLIAVPNVEDFSDQHEDEAKSYSNEGVMKFLEKHKDGDKPISEGRYDAVLTGQFWDDVHEMFKLILETKVDGLTHQVQSKFFLSYKNGRIRFRQLLVTLGAGPSVNPEKALQDLIPADVRIKISYSKKTNHKTGEPYQNVYIIGLRKKSRILIQRD